MATARRIFSLALYNLTLPFGLLAMLPSAIVKLRRRGGTPKDFLQKTGRYPSRILRKLAEMEHPIWLHAVSVGEANIAVKLIKELRRRQPNRPIVLSTTTTTGQQVAVAGLPEAEDIVVLYNPIDFPPTVERALHLIRPALIILIEAEVWPNLCIQAKRRHIPIALVNARMSPRSESRYRRARGLVAPVFSLLESVCVQEAEDIERFAGIGIPKEVIQHTGSIKFDPPPPPDPALIEPLNELLRPLIQWRPDSRIILAASTFPGEEALIGESFKVLRHQFPELFLIVVPRHVERTKQVLADLDAIGLQAVRRTTLPIPDASEVDCLVVDTTGELSRWQALATVVVIGKSFLSTGGQNPAEAAALGIPTVLGPNMQNFDTLVAHMLRVDGTVQLGPTAELTPVLSNLLANEATARRIGENARAVLEPHRGATEKTAEVVLGLIP